MSDVNIEAEFTLNEQPDIQADFSIKLTPEKVSQLENDLNYQTQEQVQEAIQAESDVINARIDDEVNTLNSAIESEAATRAETDTSLQNGINTLNDDLTLEISNRTSADEVLQGNIDTVSSNLTTEISDRQDADSTLQGNINTVANDLSIEETARINADTTLQGNIDTLSGTVTSNYNTLDGKITDEATARGNADTTLQNNIDTLSDTVTSNYNTLSSAISDETSARQSADATLQNNITAEATARGNADTTLQGNIDTLSGTVSSNYNTLNGKITDEATARGNADDVLDGKISDNKTSIDNHVADKTNPHEVTKSQVGLGNVDNTSDLNKPISTATQNALNTKVSNTREINGYSLSSDITLTASDVDALPDTTTINDLTTTAQQNALNSGANTSNIGQIATNTQNISNEATNRQNADNNLQSQIDALVVASDVFDIVGTYAELQAYDISTVPVNDIIKVLVDSTHNNAATYYRCVENDNVKSWSYIGAEGAYYTKSEADGRFVEQTTTVNGQALSSNITLDAEDVGALPDSTTIGNGTLTIQKNGSTIDSFGANDTGNTTVNITVPTATSDLTNDSGFITGIDSSDVTTALGYTPYNSSNPSGYQANVIETVKVNNTALTPDSSKAVNISVPTDTSDLTNNAGYITGINSTDVTNALGYTPYDSTNPNGYTSNTGTVTSVNNANPDANGNVTLSIPAAQVNSDWNATSGKAQILNKPSLATVATSGSYNDLSNKPTIPAAVTVDSALSSTSTNPVQNKVINSALSGKYDASNPNGYTSNVGTVTKVNNTSPDSSGNVTLSIPAAQIQSDWTQTTTTAKDYIKNKPNLATVATSGSYNDLSNKPTIPTVNNATLTIQKNGTTVQTFTANASSNVSCNITVPTNTNELTNGAGFITSSAIPTIATSVSGSSTNAETVGAKLFYDTCGDIETLINAL